MDGTCVNVETVRRISRSPVYLNSALIHVLTDFRGLQHSVSVSSAAYSKALSQKKRPESR